MSVSDPVRLGLVGCGRLAELGHVPAAARSVDVEVVAVADPDPGRRSHVASLAGTAVGSYPDLPSLLAGSAVDAVVLATPATAHLADAERVVAAGLPVLVEKPPAPDAIGAAALAALGDGVFVGFNRRFDPAIAPLRPAVPATGPLDLDLAIRYRRASWSAHTVRDEVLLDLVPHLVDLARWLTGSDVTSMAATEVHPDHAELQLGLGRGRARVVASADALHEERVVVRDAADRELAAHRTGGPLDAVAGRVRALRHRAAGRSPVHPLVVSLAAELDAFAGAVRGAGPGQLATAADGLAAMCVVDAARTSAGAGGAPVPVPDLREPSC
ncbi:MAG TPA: Gfo/Idh/MocA family oxidoreductase [Acidimicrobiales bacterium]|nr:Gfo/Idh/MocA family oxidoreductase [Acidimicrobiales bacterium]